MVKKASEAVTGTDTVTVALKHPTGILLEVFKPEETMEPVLGGGVRSATVHRSYGQRFALNGNRVPFGMRPTYNIIGGYALTPGVPRELWEKWQDQHKDSDLVVNGLITAWESPADAEDFARDPDNIELRHGAEPLRRKDDPRTPKNQTREGKFVDAIEEGEG